MRRNVLWRGAHSPVKIILLIVCYLVPIPVFADGIGFWTDPLSSLKPMQVNEQRAVIAYKDGVQRMFIAINIQKPPSAQDTSRAGVWIFPVPGAPDRTKVEVAAFIPKLEGRGLDEACRGFRRWAKWVALNTQTYWFSLVDLIYMHGKAGGIGGTEGIVDGATSHKQIDQWGIHAEIITANSVDGLAHYLRKKNVNVAGEQLSSFSSYLSDKYVLEL